MDAGRTIPAGRGSDPESGQVKKERAGRNRYVQKTDPMGQSAFVADPAGAAGGRTAGERAGPGAVPRYETVWRKRDAVALDGSEESLKQVVSAAMKKMDSPDDVCSLGLFSNLDEDLSWGLGCLFGNLSTQACNTITIQTPAELSTHVKHPNELYALFQELTNRLHPFYSFIRNNLDSRPREPWGGKPNRIHWANYFADPLVERIGRRRLQKLPQAEFVPGGVYLRAFEALFDRDNVQQLQALNSLEKALGIPPAR